MDGLPIEEGDPSLKTIFVTVIDIFTKYEKQERVTIPLLDVIGLLYESGTLVKITDPTL